MRLDSWYYDFYRQYRDRLSYDALRRAADRWRGLLSEDYRTAMYRVRSVAGQDARPFDFSVNTLSKLPATSTPSRGWTTNPLLARLQTRAAWAMFDFLGLSAVPRAYWQILRREPDPVKALGAMARAFNVTLDDLKLRTSPKFQDFLLDVTLVSQADLNPLAFTPDMRARLGALVRYGDRERARELKSVVVALNETEELFRLTPVNSRFRAHAVMISLAAELRLRASRITVAEAVALRDQSVEWAELSTALARLRPINPASPSDRAASADGQEFPSLQALEYESKASAVTRLVEVESLQVGSSIGASAVIDEVAGDRAVNSKFHFIRMANAFHALGLTAGASVAAIKKAFTKRTVDQYPSSNDNAVIGRYRTAVRARDYLIQLAH
jgi:hypothetical protein